MPGVTGLHDRRWQDMLGIVASNEATRSSPQRTLISVQDAKILRCHFRDRVFFDKPRPDIDFRRLIRRMAQTINKQPDYNDATVASIRVLAAKYKVPAETRIPARCSAEPELRYESRLLGSKRVHFVLDGVRLGSDNVSRAAEVVSQLTPRFQGADALRIVRIDLRLSRLPAKAQARLAKADLRANSIACQDFASLTWNFMTPCSDDF